MTAGKERAAAAAPQCRRRREEKTEADEDDEPNAPLRVCLADASFILQRSFIFFIHC
jgi:hypothetical protein